MLKQISFALVLTGLTGVALGQQWGDLDGTFYAFDLASGACGVVGAENVPWMRGR